MQKKEDPESKNVQPCGNPECTMNGELKCTRCKTSYYCSKECQHICWKTHKKTCKKETEFLDVDGLLPDTKHDIGDKMFRMSSNLEHLGIGHSSLPHFHLEYSRKYPSEKYGISLLRDSYTNNHLHALTKATGNFDELIASFGSWKQILSKR